MNVRSPIVYRCGISFGAKCPWVCDISRAEIKFGDVPRNIHMTLNAVQYSPGDTTASATFSRRSRFYLHWLKESFMLGINCVRLSIPILLSVFYDVRKYMVLLEDHKLFIS